MRGLDAKNLESRPELKAEASLTEPPRCPLKQYLTEFDERQTVESGKRKSIAIRSIDSVIKTTFVQIPDPLLCSFCDLVQVS